MIKYIRAKGIYLFVLVLIIASSVIIIKLICIKKSGGVEFVIGMSQANLTEPWRISMNDEIIEASKKYKNIKIVYKDAGGDTDKQKKDINELVDDGVDLLIVSINDSNKLTPLVRQVYKSMPVIVLDRAVEGYDYSLYIGPDNEKIGTQAGNFVINLIGQGKGKVIEVQGALDSSPVISRSNGFRSVLKDHKNIEISNTIVCNWQRDEAEDKVTQALQGDKDVNVIFAHNDYMALGAYKAVYKLGLKNIKIIGVDGLTGENSGLDLVSKGILSGTFTCKTGGSEAVNYAIDILNKRSDIPKKIILKSDKITVGNVNQYLNNKSKNLVDNKNIVLGYAQLMSESRWRDANAKSIKDAANDASINLDFREEGYTQKDQKQLIRELIKKRVDIIAFSPFVKTGWDDVLFEAKNAGIPVILCDRSVDSDDSLWTCNIGSDFQEEGRRAARLLIEHFKDKEANIFELKGNIGSAPEIERELGFNEVIKDHHNYKIVAEGTGNFNLDEGKEVMKKFINSKNKKINMVFALNDDMALGAIDAIKEAGLVPGKDIIVIGIDATKQALRSIKKGEMYSTVECNPLLGPQLMKMARLIMSGEEVPLKIVNAEDVFTKINSAKEFKNRKY
ncbi:substrate-binding domain-containing protein [Clostridium estertheticum]|uniref:substrate-binding domain-containing protein n=1 Tax=Clostridium estertheticum TaxID=238834 RepID=UPI001CF55B63|nr:substrate-binding domain-containing protein [Clostridium estertheticum]MCB2307902.1 substrate-binding domain-containing protein [Clostridium estertheticum]MCB2346026.1 substrate-binding domain-containing protein [Clostridium estertheticum]MCB2351285.1 substrate-binding domain-containing protein [Clostridium estertheticum]WAG44172.1 substrate-binding domain-containing protein [Clostridium estertheticum]